MSSRKQLRSACCAFVLVAGSARPQTHRTPTPKFEVASIKPCTADSGSGERGGGNIGEPSPGRLNLNCQSVMGLIRMAYIFFADGHLHPGVAIPIVGGPGWVDSERYSINAAVEGAQSQEQMRGPMMQALLEERFYVKVHRETREIPVYALTVARGGPKLPPFREGSCNPIDFTKFPPSVPEKPCPSLGKPDGPNVTIDAQGATVADFCKFFLSRLDRPVIEKTGLRGRFNFHLTYAEADAGTTTDNNLAGASIFTAIQQQLGLKLERAKGPGEFLVIDRVERPSEN
jgi:uncharacterized protein (TIGR03435 family)